MADLEIALVSRDPELRAAVAAAFEGAPAHWRVGLFDRVPVRPAIVVTCPDTEAPDAIAFDPAAPELALQAVAALEAGAGRIVAVTSASGGAGATTIALHLAALFARSGSTCVVDLSDGAADRLGLPADARRFPAPVEVGGAVPNEDQKTSAALPVSGGFRLLLPPQETDNETARAMIQTSHRLFDWTVIDAPARFGPGLTGTPGRKVVVVPPSPPAARRAREFMERITDPVVVLNRTGPGGETTRRALERLVGRKVTLELPCSPRLRDAEDDFALLTSWSRWWWGLQKLARSLFTHDPR